VIRALPVHAGTLRWGSYERAIQRWEVILERRPPYPTIPANSGRTRLAPAIVEWMMGLPLGWVTDLDLPRTAQHRALGNGVVPQQASYALTMLLADLRAARQEVVA